MSVNGKYFENVKKSEFSSYGFVRKVNWSDLDEKKMHQIGEESKTLFNSSTS